MKARRSLGLEVFQTLEWAQSTVITNVKHVANQCRNVPDISLTSNSLNPSIILVCLPSVLGPSIGFYLVFNYQLFFWYNHIGFLTKVKKILECVCFKCSKLKVDEVSSREPHRSSCHILFIDILSVKSEVHKGSQATRCQGSTSRCMGYLQK